MTTDQLAAIRARLDAATPWPWEQEKDNNGLAVEVTAFDPDEPDEPWGVAVAYRCCGHGKDRCEDNAALIANAPADLADLLAYVGQLEGLLRDLCEDSRAAAEVVRLRKLFGQVLVACDDPHVKGQSVAADMIARYIRDAIAPVAKKPGGA